MQQELKLEAFRMENVRKSVESTCFDRCVAAPQSGSAVVLNGLNPSSLFTTQNEAESKMKNDLTGDESLCLDRCAWKYMLTAKLILQTLSKAKNLKDPQQGGR